MKTTTAYRIEQRWHIAGHQCINRVYSLDPLTLQPLTAERGQELLARMVHDHPERYGPNSGYRLVLLSADEPSR